MSTYEALWKRQSEALAESTSESFDASGSSEESGLGSIIKPEESSADGSGSESSETSASPGKPADPSESAETEMSESTAIPSGTEPDTAAGQSFPLWAIITIGAVMLAAAAVIVLIVLRGRGKKKRRTGRTVRPQMTVQPDVPPASKAPPMAVCNLQGIGRRQEQQDAFAMSPLAQYGEQGLLTVLCDGMGGMTDGRAIANRAAEQVLAQFPFGEPDALDGVWSERLRAINREIFGAYQGCGGATLVAAYIRQGRLWFWCIGDSDLYLLREGRLYAVNRRHEFGNELLRGVLEGRRSLQTALTDSQRGSLSEYVGNRTIDMDRSLRPYALQAGDKLLLCSDGVSDVLNLDELTEAMRLDAAACCARLEEHILAAGLPEQDNYTAIVVDFGVLGV